MLGIYLSVPWGLLIYLAVWNVIAILISWVWYNKWQYHDEEDYLDWDEETSFKMDYEPGYGPDDMISAPRTN